MKVVVVVCAAASAVLLTVCVGPVLAERCRRVACATNTATDGVLALVLTGGWRECLGSHLGSHRLPSAGLCCLPPVPVALPHLNHRHQCHQSHPPARTFSSHLPPRSAGRCHWNHVLGP
ncbi:hypothetical protein E2C01_058374 [Portunus trituberculatus]|uniref:Secreted protein n=1 Tax=Portunus trituberculatus TaxID=210409 RepID=A0A5B7GZP3_PORTR|nr:hypothetical protein [Portunus trituberculatus]